MSKDELKKISELLEAKYNELIAEANDFFNKGNLYAYFRIAGKAVGVLEAKKILYVNVKEGSICGD